MSFCQLRSSFLARLASSSFFVFLRTSLMSFPSRVSYNQRETMTCFWDRKSSMERELRTPGLWINPTTS